MLLKVVVATCYGLTAIVWIASQDANVGIAMLNLLSLYIFITIDHKEKKNG